MDRAESLDWSNEETLRYLSAINCLHNYAIGKLNENELTENGEIHLRRNRPSKKICLSFAEALEEIQLFDADTACPAQCS